MAPADLFVPRGTRVLVSIIIIIIFFFACLNFSESWTSLKKIPGSAPGHGDKFDWSMTGGELITQYNTTCHFLFLF